MIPAPLPTELPALRAPVSQKDIAAVLGVHVTTVSLALRGSPRLPSGTRRDVLRVAEELGYRKDAVMNALSGRRQPATGGAPTIVFICNTDPGRLFRESPHFGGFFAGARSGAEREGFGCVAVDGSVARDDSAGPLSAHPREIAGAILGGISPKGTRLVIPWNHRPAVRIEARQVASELTFVGNDQCHSIWLAMMRLAERGHRRIALATSDLDEISTGHQFTESFHAMHHHLGLPGAPVPPLVWGFDKSQDERAAALSGWVRGYRIDAVISNWNDVPALLASAPGTSRAAVAFASLNLTPGLVGRVPGVIQNHEAVGFAASELVSQMIKRGDTGGAFVPSSRYIRGTWRDLAPNLQPA